MDALPVILGERHERRATTEGLVDLTDQEVEVMPRFGSQRRSLGQMVAEQTAHGDSFERRGTVEPWQAGDGKLRESRNPRDIEKLPGVSGEAAWGKGQDMQVFTANGGDPGIQVAQKGQAEVRAECRRAATQHLVVHRLDVVRRLAHAIDHPDPESGELGKNDPAQFGSERCQQFGGDEEAVRAAFRELLFQGAEQASEFAALGPGGALRLETEMGELVMAIAGVFRLSGKTDAGVGPAGGKRIKESEFLDEFLPVDREKTLNRGGAGFIGTTVQIERGRIGWRSAAAFS